MTPPDAPPAPLDDLPRLTRRRLGLTLAGGLALILAVVLTCPLVGIEDGRLALLDPRALWAGARGPDNLSWQIFLLSRLPRVLAALLVGAALAAAGCCFQALFRNPLAEPYTLGVSSGASLAAVLAIRLGLDRILGHDAIGISALLGAGATVSLVWRLARVDRALPAATLLLAGITVSMAASAATLLVQYTADFAEVYRILRWMMGGLDWMRYGPVAHAAPPIALACLLLLGLARDLNALSAGDDAAASLGVDTGRTTTIAFFLASTLVGAAIAVAGPIGFIGLLVPHTLRALVGPDHRILLPAAMAGGGVLLALCDTLARIVLAPRELPVGILTALAGGPFFLYLLASARGRRSRWTGA